MKELFKFGGHIDNKTNIILTITGGFIILLAWYLLTMSGNIIPPKILPSPIAVFKSFPNLISDPTYDLLSQWWYSLKLNLFGTTIGILCAIPLGFILGIYALPRGLFEKYFGGLRYLPPPAVSGIFVAIFAGYGFDMKVGFLAFAIFISILPAVICKISDLQNPANSKDFVYLQTIKTLGANNWQKLTKVYIPYVMGKLWDDIIILTAITWTYIIIVEILNRTGGMGDLIFVLRRAGMIDGIYAVLLCIIFTGIVLVYILTVIGNIMFPYKSASKPLFTRIKNFFIDG